MPKRIQRKRTKGWQMPENTVYVGRPGKWGNPFKVGMYLGDVPSLDVFRAGLEHLPADTIINSELAVKLFKVRLSPSVKVIARVFLAGKDLACWCPLDQPCHADVLLEVVNRQP